METVIEECTFGNTDLTKIHDGMDQLPRSFLHSLSENISYNSQVSKIKQAPQGIKIEYVLFI
jgi:monoamine oxidase